MLEPTWIQMEEEGSGGEGRAREERHWGVEGKKIGRGGAQCTTMGGPTRSGTIRRSLETHPPPRLHDTAGDLDKESRVWKSEELQ